MTETRRVHVGGDAVGESPVWCVRTGRLLWVDIVGCRVNALVPASGEFETWKLPDFVTSIGLCVDGRAVLGLRREAVLWDWGRSTETLAFPEPDMPGNRLNEGSVGPDGALWVGTMQDNIGPGGEPVGMTARAGKLHRVWPDGSVEALSEDIFGICNTMAWRNDGTFCCADTLEDQLYVYDRSPSGLGRRQVLLAGGAPGLPDGSALDSEGYLWNCRFGGGCLVRISPEGAIDRIVELPCQQPTSCTFGGPDLKTLFVTSARFGMSAERRGHPDEGAVHALDLDIAGTPAFLFG
ncbi:SMP-30/gluconolactonase/LRE family protein [Sphingomonas sp. Tas61C01]|uniref:SMP-30/gluconolactonase/LRE family protein n=1 Tax=Sphingomonas sp. Tas61C01 TaxID=3458297 RepID=UPI00403E9C73